MARTKHLVVGNWKMYIDSLPKAKELAGKITRTASRLKRTEVVICPSHAFLGALSTSVTKSKVQLGAQDLSMETEAARTGETSAYMLKSVGAVYVIVGHSERRALGESNATIATKTARALKAGVTPIVCIGERERDFRGEFLAFLENQIRGSLTGITKAKASQVVIAYEPVWAIGKNSSDAVTPHVLHETTLFIKKILVSLYGRNIGTSIKIIYGGSVEAPNAAALITGGTVDGVLVGHASTDASEFAAILKSVDRR
jgi:triosephosphate isomerase (TIM)